MYGSELEEALLYDPFTKHLLRGIFAADNLPRLIDKPCLIVANTDSLKKAGTHWVAFYFDSFGRGEYFDSYGLPPYIPEHREFLQRNCTRWTHNNVQLQGLMSKVCGEYCVLYLAHRARGLFPYEFVNTFKTFNSYEKNDNFVRNMFKSKFKNVRHTRKYFKGQCCCSKR